MEKDRQYVDLLDVLNSSVQKNGEQPLTNTWMRNIVLMSQDRYSEAKRHLEKEGKKPALPTVRDTRTMTDVELLKELVKRESFKWWPGMRSVYHEAVCVDFERVGKKVKLAGDDWVTWFDESEVYPTLACEVLRSRMLHEVFNRAPGVTLGLSTSGAYELFWGVHFVSSRSLGRALVCALLLLDEDT